MYFTIIVISAPMKSNLMLALPLPDHQGTGDSPLFRLVNAMGFVPVLFRMNCLKIEQCTSEGTTKLY
jgi:hypothetical protein